MLNNIGLEARRDSGSSQSNRQDVREREKAGCIDTQREVGSEGGHNTTQVGRTGLECYLPLLPSGFLCRCVGSVS